MKTRPWHRIFGLLLTLPMIGWALTGLVFFVKPGYGGAYEVLAARTYPQDAAAPVTPGSDWLEYRGFRTILGDHLLVRTSAGWQHLNPQNLQPRTEPSEEEVRRLVADAFSANPTRYGNITNVSGTTVTTNTGVEVRLDWKRVSLQQQGRDTRRIDRLYKVHYLQWTGIESLDKVIGLAGLVLVLCLTVLGIRLAFGGR